MYCSKRYAYSIIEQHENAHFTELKVTRLCWMGRHSCISNTIEGSLHTRRTYEERKNFPPRIEKGIHLGAV